MNVIFLFFFKERAMSLIPGYNYAAFQICKAIVLAEADSPKYHTLGAPFNAGHRCAISNHTDVDMFNLDQIKHL